MEEKEEKDVNGILKPVPKEIRRKKLIDFSNNFCLENLMNETTCLKSVKIIFHEIKSL